MARVLLKSGIVVTQDKALGVLPKGDVLIDGDRIAEIAPDLSIESAETIDCAGHFVLPGLINAHIHTWQTALRSVAANWTLLEYFRHVHAGLATVFTPADIHIATLAGALNQLDHGVTTLVDWCQTHAAYDTRRERHATHRHRHPVHDHHSGAAFQLPHLHRQDLGRGHSVGPSRSVVWLVVPVPLVEQQRVLVGRAERSGRHFGHLHGWRS